MKFNYKLGFILIFIGIIALSASAVYAASSDSQDVKVTVDGVDFVLFDSCEVFEETEDSVYFSADSEISGYIAPLGSAERVNAYTKNDFSNGYLVEKIENISLNADLYAYSDYLNDLQGCFIIFQKDKKEFIFDIYANSTTSSDDTISDMAFLIKKFDHDNDIAPITSLK